MRNILYLFIRSGGLITFILLEGLCFYLIVNYNTEQGRTFLHSANLLSGSMNERYDNLMDYLSLEAQRDSMAAENARLRRQLGISRFDIALNQDTIVSKQDTQRYIFLPAEVIDQTTQLANNYLTIGRGLNQGVKERMGVISSNGVVGMVTHVSRHFAKVISLLHTQVELSVRHVPSGYMGRLVWEGQKTDQMLLLDVPRFVDVQARDTIVTSGYSLFFPAEILVGEVLNSSKVDGDPTQKIQVKLFQDMRNIDQVYVIKDFFRQELESLKSQAQ